MFFFARRSKNEAIAKRRTQETRTHEDIAAAVAAAAADDKQNAKPKRKQPTPLENHAENRLMKDGDWQGVASHRRSVCSTLLILLPSGIDARDGYIEQLAISMHVMN